MARLGLSQLKTVVYPIIRLSTIPTWWCRISLAHRELPEPRSWRSWPMLDSGVPEVPGLPFGDHQRATDSTAIDGFCRENLQETIVFLGQRWGRCWKIQLLDQHIEHHMIKLIIKILLKPYETTYKCLALTHYVSFRLWIDAFKLLSLRPVQKKHV